MLAMQQQWCMQSSMQQQQQYWQQQHNVSQQIPSGNFRRPDSSLGPWRLALDNRRLHADDAGLRRFFPSSHRWEAHIMAYMRHRANQLPHAERDLDAAMHSLASSGNSIQRQQQQEETL
ncbi:uncharacterized protein LOC120451124 [Drosophila santomea]|uniref:uncharacterized protein LOC120451121 n=1 Tax=Drosophila santomea TaxID=129105 RepID=UPI0019535F00|nr:uncharacterized protein LOC120451121 [Drosophila santomea]XP_039490476.1 uncharacterized protein LOC120451124 [Drosophila santomea]